MHRGFNVVGSMTELWAKRFETSFPGLLTTLQETPLSFENGQDTQALENMVYVDGASGLRERLSVADVCSFVHSVADRWRSRSGDFGARVFYAWYDEQAWQLRMSMIAGELLAGLPFRAKVTLLSDPEPVAQQYLQGADLVRWNELELADSGNTTPSVDGADEIMVFASEYAKS